MNFGEFVNDKDLISAADKFAEEKHKGQIRKFSKEPYINHPRSVSEIVKQHGGNAEMIASALLHDVVEDCGVTLSEIQEKFGSVVAKLVGELTLPKAIDKSDKKSEYIANKMAVMSSNGLTIKLSDRLNNVSDFETAHPKFVSKYAPKTKFILDSLKDSERTLNSSQNQLFKTIMSKIESYL